MPTVVLLDVSLSMSRPVPTSDTTENHTRLTIASTAINTFLDYLSVHAKLEYVALVTYSSLYEVSVPFTRDYDLIRNKLPLLEEGDKTCIETALLGVNQLILSEWGYQTPVQTIIITDGSCGVGAIGRTRIIQALPLPPSYPTRIHVLPIVSPHDPCLQQAMPLYQKIVDLATGTANSSNLSISCGAIFCPDQLSVPGAISAMTRLCEQYYQEFWCTLKCGQLESRVQLFPAPQAALHDGLVASYTIAHQLHVVGFLHQQDLGTPIAISKHLVIPQAQAGSAANKENYESKTPTKETSSTDGSATEEDMSDPSKVPNFCVLLHGALKVESMTAIVQLGSDWWGTLTAWCEASRARRSCLLLSVLRPGVSAAPWLGPLDQLGPADDNTSPAEPFPIRSWRSYSSGGSGCAWARPHALLADVQKVLRHARKLPDKTQHLYKELNRLRRAAISLGFSELLTCVGNALERECAALPTSAPPECALQLAHAAAALRDPRTALDIKHVLQPLAANFTVTSMSH
ncbi:integrator complex subunit 14 isoform X1 [Galleria mellonella]|uniref:Integrator complex subunit 14 n=1 Tax=Galleria mellonella TaxID=7137 RepID=A0A6J1X4I5_GALME|nr:integrator complex subunit 14 isoform X1 [Galleria mellonella]